MNNTYSIIYHTSNSLLDYTKHPIYMTFIKNSELKSRDFFSNIIPDVNSRDMSFMSFMSPTHVPRCASHRQQLIKSNLNYNDIKYLNRIGNIKFDIIKSITIPEDAKVDLRSIDGIEYVVSDVCSKIDEREQHVLSDYVLASGYKFIVANKHNLDIISKKSWHVEKIPRREVNFGNLELIRYLMECAGCDFQVINELDIAWRIPHERHKSKTYKNIISMKSVYDFVYD